MTFTAVKVFLRMTRSVQKHIPLWKKREKRRETNRYIRHAVGGFRSATICGKNDFFFFLRTSTNANDIDGMICLSRRNQSSPLFLFVLTLYSLRSLATGSMWTVGGHSLLSGL